MVLNSSNSSQKFRKRKTQQDSYAYDVLEPRKLLAVEAFPTLLPEQLGSQLYSGLLERDFVADGETDTYTINFESGVDASFVVVPEDSALQVSVELVSPGGTVIQAGDAAAGDEVSLGLLPIATDGVHEINVSNISSLGNYTLHVFLNGVEEQESFANGPSNDLVASAQSIESSARSVVGASDRLAVVGLASGDDDYYSFDLTAGQSASVSLRSNDTTGLALELYSPNGTLITRGLSDAIDVDEYVSGYLPTETGTYFARVSGGGSNEQYSLVVARGADLDFVRENGTLQDVSDTGTILAGISDSTLSDDFESGDLGSQWTTNTTTGRIRVTGDFGAADGSFALLMDNPGGFSTNEAIWTVDLSRVSQPVLAFSHVEWNDEHTTLPLDFSGSVAGDGISISNDGINWRRIFNPPAQSQGVWTQYNIDLAAEAAAAGIVLSSETQIKFQQTDDSSLTVDGRGWDEIEILADRNLAFTFEAEAGDVLNIESQTPGDATGEPENNLDPILELYAPSGVLVAANNDGAADGKNALISYTTSVAGTFEVRGAAVTGTGELVVSVSGATGVSATALAVEESSLVDGGTVNSFPDTIELVFNDGLLLNTVEAADLTVNGSPAASATIVQGNVVSFDVSGLATGDGSYTVTLPAGSVQAINGATSDEFSLAFTLDSTGPVVTTSTLASGDIVQPGTVSVTVSFSEEIDETELLANLDDGDVTLVDDFAGTTFFPTNAIYSSANNELVLDFAELLDGSYTLTLVSSPDAFVDLNGNPLNGGPSFPLPSGQGDTAGDNFVIDFFVDSVSEIFSDGTTVANLPLGSLVYDANQVSAFHSPTDVDNYTISLDAGQTASILFTPALEGDVRGTISIYDPSNNLVAATTAANADETILIQTAPISAAGTYRIEASSEAGTGRYELDLFLNAWHEQEEVSGVANDSPSSAENIDSSFIDVGSGQRAAVFGSGDVSENDWFSFSSTAGETYSLVLTAITGGVLGGGSLWDSTGFQQIGESTLVSNSELISNFVAPTTGQFLVQIPQAPLEYSLVVTRNQTFDSDLSVDLASGQPLGPSNAVVGHLVGEDFFTFEASAGDNLTIETETFGGAPVSQTQVTQDFESGDASQAPNQFFLHDGSEFLLDPGDNLSAAGLPGVTAFAGAGGGSAGSASATLGLSATGGVGGSQAVLLNLTNDGTTTFSFGGAQQSIGVVANPANHSAFVDVLAPAGVPLSLRIESPFTGTNNGFEINFVGTGAYQTIGGVVGTDLTPIAGGTFDPTGTAQILVATPVDGNIAVGDSDIFIDNFSFAPTGESSNTLDPIVDLIGPDGTVLATNDNGATDGRNALLSQTAAESGTFGIRVHAASDTTGEYSLSVTGATGTQAFAVDGFFPDDERFPVAPTSMFFGFDQQLDLTTLDAADLQFDGVPATAVSVLNGNSLEFTLPTLAEGSHTVTIAAGAIGSLSGQGIEAFASELVVDLSGPRVIGSSVQEGDILGSGTLSVQIEFDELLLTSNLDTSDVELLGPEGESFVPTALEFDEATTTLTVDFASLAEGNYSLTLKSGNGLIEDLVGNDLDGEAISFPIPGNVSGDGIPGGDFTVNFSIDAVSTPFPVPLSPLAGSLSHSGQVTGTFSQSGDSDVFTIDLEPSQHATILLNVDPSVIGEIALVAPDSTIVDTAVATSAGSTVFLQTAPIDQAGTYSVVVESVDGAGVYNADFYLNSALEEESFTGVSNDSAAMAQVIDPSEFTLPGGADHLGVVGSVGLVDVDFYEFTLGANQLNSVIADTSDVLVQLYDSNGQLVAASDTNNVAGVAAINGFRSTNGGTYRVAVSAAVDTPVDYSVAVIRNGLFQVTPVDTFGSSFTLIEAGTYLGSFQDTFDVDFTSISGDGSLESFTATGLWHITDFFGAADEEGNSDPHSAYFGNEATGNFALGRVAGTLTSSPIQLGSTAELSFAYRLDTETGTNFDRAEVRVSIDDGLTWTTVADKAGLLTQSLAWRSVGVDLTAFADQEVLVQFWFDSIDTISNGGLGWQVDDVVVSGGSVAGVDQYQFTAQSGESFTFETFTPGDAVGEFANNADPTLGITDAAGNLLVTDDNGAVDGRNSLVSFVAPADGIYTVNIAALPGTEGSIGLLASGAFSPTEFRAEISDPIDGSLLTDFPDSIRVSLSDNVLISSVDAGDLLVNGVPADSVSVIDGKTLEFDVTSANQGDGLYEISLPSNSLTSAFGTSVGPLVATFDSDATDPTVVSSSIAEGDTVNPGTITVQVEFSEQLAETDIGAEDVLLTDATTGETFVPSNFNVGTPLVDGVSVAASSQLDLSVSGFNRPASNLTDGLGNTTVTPDGNPGAPEGMWLSVGNGFVASDDLDPALDFDLGSSLRLDHLLLYNYNESGFLGRGVAEVEIFASDDDFVSDIRSLGVFNFDQASGDANNPGQIVELAGEVARYVRFDILSNQNSSQFPAALNNVDNDFVGISEVEFFASPVGSNLERTATISYEGIPEGTYTLSLTSAADAFRDRRGNLLDGAPSFPLPSGDGTPGDPFVVNFNVDVGNLPLPLPLEPVDPLGGQVFETAQNGSFASLGDVDAFTIELEAGQIFSAALNPIDAGILGQIELLGPSGASLGVSQASAADESVLLQTIPLTVAGIYTLQVSNVEGTGNYETDIRVGTAIEPESVELGVNDSLATAQDIEGSQIDLEGSANRLAVGGVFDTSDDYFQFTATAGELISFVLASEDTAELELLDASGASLAAGISNRGATTVDAFVASSSSTYFVKVSGIDGNSYNLVVTRGGQFEVESNDVRTDGNALVWQAVGGNQYEAQVIGGLSQIARSVDPDDYPTNSDISNAVPGVTLSSVLPDGSTPTGETVQSITNAGFVPSTGSHLFGHNGSGSWASNSQWLRADFASLIGEVSIDVIGDDSSDPGILQAYNAAGELLEQVFGFNTPGGNPQSLSISREIADIAYILAAGSGSQTAGLDNLVVEGDPLDFFSVELSAGDVLEIVTSTPGDALGAPDNAFDPAISLFDSSGFLLAQDDNSADDGRNAQLVYTVPADAGGQFAISVSSAIGGSYTLLLNRTTDATVTNSEPTVVSSTPSNAENVAMAPTTLDVQFSEAIRVDSVQPTDLTFSDPGISVDSIEVLDGQSARFFLTVPNVEGSYDYSISAGSVTDLQGEANEAYTGSFVIDQTGPRVVSQIPALQGSTPFNSITFNFNEDIDPATFTLDDIVSFTGPGGTNLSGSLIDVVVEGNSAVVSFSDQATFGTFTMVIGPDITDVVGNLMNQNGTGTGDTFTATIDLQSPDLTIVADSLAIPSSAIFGQQIDISWIVQNVGTDPAVEGWSDRIYLSADGTIDDTDQLLATIPASTVPLNAGQTYNGNATVELPLSGDFPAGDYFIIVQTDGLGGQPETNEINNVSVSAVLPITLPPVPDLVVTDIAGPTSAQSGQDILISWTITNQGDGDAVGPFTDQIFLSDDASLGSDQFFGSFEFTGVIAAGETVTRSQTISLPANLQGARYVIVRTDSSNQVLEISGESNNTTIDDAPIDVTLSPFPNLVVSEVITPPDAFSGQTAVVEWVVTNEGTAATNSPLWRDRVFLSEDQFFDNSDVFLGNANNPSFLNPGESYRNSLTVTLPDGADDDFFFIVITDVFNEVFEFESESDNTGVGGPTDVQLTPPPDLQVTDVQAPSQTFSGQTVAINWTVANNGTGNTRSARWADFVWLSEDNVLDGSDTFLTSAGHVGALAPSESYLATANVTLPVGISGDFFFIVETDGTNLVFEHVFESNNTGFDDPPTTVNLTPPPDLEVDIDDAPETALAGQELTIDYSVTNFGATVTPNNFWQDRLYLSPSAVFDPSTAILLDTQNRFGALEPGLGYDASLTGAIPDGTVGNFFAIVVTDSQDVVFEINNENNIGVTSSPIDIDSRPADLVVTAISTPSLLLDSPPIAQSGGALVLSWTVQNQGTGPTSANGWTDQVFLSADATFGNGDDVLLETVNRTGGLEPLDSYSVANELLSIPFTVAPGEYNLFVRTDAGDAVFENDNGNNVRLFEYTVRGGQPSSTVFISRNTPDLTPISVTAAATANSGDKLTVDWTVQNTGADTNANFWFDDIYLSSDATISGDDLFLGRIQRSNVLAAGDQYSQSRDFDLPIDLSGDFFVLLDTDATNRVIEDAGEANNEIASTALTTVSLSPVPDLAVTAVDAPADGFSGQTFSVSWTVENLGGATTNGTWFDSVYLSLDQVFDRNSDTFLGFANRLQNLAPGESYTQTADFTIPNGFSGPFTVFVAADSNDRVHERSAESNNIGFDSDEVLVSLTPPADFVVGTITVPPTAVPGQQVTITYTVDNQGANVATGTWTDSIFVSSNNVWDINDPLLGRVNVGGPVAGGDSYTRTLTAALPGVVPGDYQIIIRSDILNNVAESDEDNNIGVSLDSAEIDFAALTLDVPETGFLFQGRSVYYRVDVPAGETLSVLLESVEGFASNSVYVAFERVPTPADFDFASIEPFQANQRALVPSTEAGTYFVLVEGTSVIGETGFEVTAELLEFDIFDTTYGIGGNAGNLTIEFNGSRFDRSVVARLVDADGNSRTAEQMWFESQVLAYATFDLRGLAAGSYSVIFENADGTNLSVSNGLEVVEGGSSANAPSLVAPNAIGRNRNFSFEIGWSNDGINDALAPLIVVGNTVPFGDAPGDTSFGTRLVVLGATIGDGPAGILRPGQQETIPFFSFSNNSFGDYTVFVDRLFQDLASPFDFDNLRDRLEDLVTEEQDFEQVFAQFEEQVGSTNGDFLQMLSRNASLIPLAIGNPQVYDDLLQLEVWRAEAALGQSISGVAFARELEIQIGGVSVVATNTSTSEQFQTTSLNDGSFVFRGLSNGEYTFEFDGAVVSEQPLPSIVAGNTLEDVSLTLVRGTSVQGRLVDAANGEPIANATVTIRDDQGMIRDLVVADGEGEYELRPVEAGNFTIQVDAEGRAREVQSLSISGEEFTTVDFTIDPESRIVGNIETGLDPSLADQVVVGIELLSSPLPFPLFTGVVEDGQLLANQLPAGTYDIRISLDDYQPIFLEDVQLETGVELDLGVVSLELGGQVTGTVTSTEISGSSSLTVSAFQDGVAIGTGVVDASGNYEITGLPFGTYEVRVDGIEFSTAQTVAVSDSTTPAVVDLQQLQGGTIEGQVFDSLGTAVSGVPVKLAADNGLIEVIVTDSFGNYRFDELEIGTYELSIGDETQVPVVVSALNGEAVTTSLTLDAQFGLTGTLRAVNGIPFVSATVVVRSNGQTVSRATTDGDGNYSFIVLAAGDYEILAFAEGASFEPVDVSLESGTTQVADFVAGDGSVSINIDGESGLSTEGSLQLLRVSDGQIELADSREVEIPAVFNFAQLVEGDYLFRFVGAGGVGGEGAVSVNAGLSSDISLTVQENLQYEGILSGGGVSISGTISLQREDGLIITGVADQNGNFFFEGIIAGTYDVAAYAPGYEPVTITGVEISENQSISLDLPLATTFVSGTVEGLDGNAIAGAIVALQNSEGQIIGSVATDLMGQYTVPVPAGLEVSLLFSAQDHQTAVVEFVSSEGANEIGLQTLTGGAVGLNSLPSALSIEATLASSLLSTNNELVAAISLPTWLTEVFTDIEESERHVSTSDIPQIPEDCDCSSALRNLNRAILSQDNAFRSATASGDILDAQFWLTSAIWTRNLSVTFGAALSAFVAAKALVTAATIGSWVAPTKIAATEVVAFGTAVLDVVVEARANVAEAAGVGNVQSAQSAAAQVSGTTSKLLGLTNMKNELAAKLAGSGEAAGFFSAWGQILGLFDSVLFFLGGAYQDGMLQMASSALQYEEALDQFEMDEERYLGKVDLANGSLAALTRCISECRDEEEEEDEEEECEGNCDDNENVDRPTSFDPNDILGPDGFGAENWISADSTLEYTIRFENDPIFATAPAQVVSITQTLDSDLDARTFRVGDFAIGDTFVDVPDNRAFFSDRIDLTEDLGVFVDVVAGIDVASGEAFWQFTSIDPATGDVPENPLLGFLLPNLMSPEGEGFVTYAVRPFNDRKTGVVIDAEARIVFDINEPIDTPPIFNTLDAGVPTSAVAALPATVTSTTFDVSWSGTDDTDGSGIADYTIFVSENGGPFEIFLEQTQLTSAPFIGESGSTYEFYSIARDNAGNVEAVPSTPDATTNLLGVSVIVADDLTTTENGGQVTFQVVLDLAPTADVTIAVESLNLGEGTTNVSSLVFTPENWDAPQDVIVTGVNDDVEDGDANYTVQLGPITSDDLTFVAIDPADVELTNVDNDIAGVTVTPTSNLFTDEDGGTAEFTVVLDSQPTADVTIEVASSNTDEGSVSVASVTFDADNWNVPQTVTITGVDDAVIDGDVPFSVVLSATESDDPNYDGLALPEINVANIDNDQIPAGVTVRPTAGLMTTEDGGSAQFTVVLDSQPTSTVTVPVSSANSDEGTVSITSLIFTPVNWDVPQTVTVTGANDDADDGDTSYQIQVGTTSSSDAAFDGLDPDDVTLINEDNDQAGVTVTAIEGLQTDEAGSSAQFTVVLDTQPTADVSIALGSSDLGEGLTTTNLLTFTPSNWNVAQTVIVQGQDDLFVDGNVPYSVDLQSATSDDANYQGRNVADVQLTNLDDRESSTGVVVSPLTGLQVDEAGGVDQFNVALDMQPTGDVIIPLSSSDPSKGTISTTSLVFTPDNWDTPQTVTITGQDNLVDDGDQVFTIEFGTFSSSDPNFDGLTPNAVNVVALDDDTAGVTVTPLAGLITNEAGLSDQFSVVLDSQPTSDVVINLSSSDVSEGATDQPSLTFTPDNWDTPQTVTVTGQDDMESDGDVGYRIELSVTSSDATYAGIVTDDVNLTNQDNENFARVSGVVVQDGLTQRSYVDLIEINFDKSVNFATDLANMIASGAVELTNLGVDADADSDQAMSLQASQFEYVNETLRFSWDSFAGGRTSLPDGFYELRIKADQVIDVDGLLLDGDSDNIAGGDFVHQFHVLNGDANGDMVVDDSDMQLIVESLGGRPGRSNWNPNADLDRNGAVTTRDRRTVLVSDGNQVTPPDDLANTSLDAELTSFSESVGLASNWTQVVASTLENALDADWIRFVAPASGILSATTLFAGSGASEILLNLYESTDTGLQLEDQSSTVTTTAVSGREYFVRVSGDESFSIATDYQLSVEIEEFDDFLPLINADSVLADYGYRGEGYSVAVIDTGINYNHPDLIGRVILGPDFGDNDSDPIDTVGHGTQVAGLITSSNSHSVGIANEADVIALKITKDGEQTAEIDAVFESLQWVLDNREEYNIAAVNISFGAGNVPKGTALEGLDSLYEQLHEEGVFISVAAGNDYSANDGDPGLNILAASNYAAAVGAVWDSNAGPQSFSNGVTENSTGEDRIAAFSQRDPDLDLFAPGGDILGLGLNGGLVVRDGTSLSAPIVAASAVLLREAADEMGLDWTPDQILEVLRRSASIIVDGDDEDNNVSATGLEYSRLDIDAAIAELGSLDFTPMSHRFAETDIVDSIEDLEISTQEEVLQPTDSA